MIRRVVVSGLVLALVACTRGADEPGRHYIEIVGNAGGGPFSPALSPDGTRLAWAQPVDGQSAVHVANADGSDPQRLSHGTWDFLPRWSPDGRWIAYGAESPDNDVFVVPSDGGEARQLTSGPGNDVAVGWLPDGSGVVLYRSGLGDLQTMVAPMDGGPVRPLVPSLGGNQHAVVSPDGSKVAFDLHRGGESTIWVQDLGGGPPRQLTTEGLEEGNPPRNMWSPDGRRVVFVSRRTGTGDLWTADVETGELQQLTSDVRNDAGHQWSPDGRWIAFVSDRGGQRDIWIVPSAGGTALRVTNDLARESSPEWSADGRTLYHQRTEGVGGLGVTAPDGGEPRMLVEWAGYSVFDAALSPDGATVLFTSDRSGNRDIWSVPFAGGEPTVFAASPLNETQPLFSPDGSQVLFVSDRAGSNDLWVMSTAGGEARRLTEWPSDEYQPRWSPNGSQIVFSSNRETTQEDLWLIPAGGGTPSRLTSFNADFSGGARWSPDGQVLYVVVADPGGANVLYQVPVSGGSPEALQVSPNAFGGEISPDGSQYAYPTIEGGWGFMEVTSTAGGAPRRLTRRTERVYQPAGIWSPDGTRLAVEDWAYGDDPTVNVLEMPLHDTTRRQLTRRPRSFEYPQAYTPDSRQVVFTLDAPDERIVSVSVAELLTSQ